MLQKDVRFEERFIERVKDTVNWLATPKGFKKFFDSGDDKAPEKEKKSTSDGAKPSGKFRFFTALSVSLLASNGSNTDELSFY